jgi:hypothetical protein
MRPPTKLQVFVNFDSKICYNPLSLPVFSTIISARLFSFPQVENEVKGTQVANVADIQGALIDVLMKVRK